MTNMKSVTLITIIMLVTCFNNVSAMQYIRGFQKSLGLGGGALAPEPEAQPTDDDEVDGFVAVRKIPENERHGLMRYPVSPSDLEEFGRMPKPLENAALAPTTPIERVRLEFQPLLSAMKRVLVEGWGTENSRFTDQLRRLRGSLEEELVTHIKMLQARQRLATQFGLYKLGVNADADVAEKTARALSFKQLRDFARQQQQLEEDPKAPEYKDDKDLYQAWLASTEYKV